MDVFQVSAEELLRKIKEWYDGYSWNGIDFVYNPYSVLSLFDGNAFKNYYDESEYYGKRRVLGKVNCRNNNYVNYITKDLFCLASLN